MCNKLLGKNMRILMVGGFQFKNDAARYYDYNRKLINGFTKLGHQVMTFSDRDVARMSNIFKSRKAGIKPCNEKLMDYIHRFKPHLVVFKHADVITQETILEIKHKYPHTKLAQLNIDALFNPDNVARINHKSGLMDANYVTTYGESLYKICQNNVPVYYIPNIVDRAVEAGRAFEGENKADLFLAYGNAAPDDSRYITAHRILDEAPDVCFSYHVSAQGTGLWGADYMDRLAECAMGLNLSRKEEKGRGGDMNDLFMYSSDRLAHYMGNGLLTFSDRDFSLDELYEEDKEMIFYSSVDELIDKLKYYKEHDDVRRKIAQAGWQKAHTAHNETYAAQFMLETLFESKISDYQWPTKPYMKS